MEWMYNGHALLNWIALSSLDLKWLLRVKVGHIPKTHLCLLVHVDLNILLSGLHCTIALDQARNTVDLEKNGNLPGHSGNLKNTIILKTQTVTVGLGLLSGQPYLPLLPIGSRLPVVPNLDARETIVLPRLGVLFTAQLMLALHSIQILDHLHLITMDGSPKTVLISMRLHPTREHILVQVAEIVKTAMAVVLIMTDFGLDLLLAVFWDPCSAIGHIGTHLPTTLVTDPKRIHRIPFTHLVPLPGGHGDLDGHNLHIPTLTLCFVAHPLRVVQDPNLLHPALVLPRHMVVQGVDEWLNPSWFK